MRIYFATNRDPNSLSQPTDFGENFSVNGLTDLRFGWADFAPDNLEHYTLSVADEYLDVGLENASVNDFSGQKLGSAAVFDMIKAEMQTNRQDCALFIHGYNCSFDEALKNTAQLKRFLMDLPMIYIVFTWPSDGSLLPFKAYASDRDDARASGVALGRGILKLADFLHGIRPQDYCGQRVHLLVHSMGNYALRWAVQAIKNFSGPQLRRLLEQVVLFAADEDDDAFEHDYKLRDLPDLARRVTVYHNPSDKALLISDFTKGNPDRLGASGPRNSRLLPDKVSVVNCESVLRFKDDPTGHQYYRLDDTVKQDVLAAIAGIQPLHIRTRKYQPETRSYRLKRTKN